MHDLIFHVCERAAWEAAVAAGRYEGSADDRRDGFIHFSTAGQLAGSIARHHAGKPDIVLIAVPPAVLGEALRWEPSRRGLLFPHLYGPLPVAAVAWVEPLRRNAAGEVELPPLAASGADGGA